MDKFLIRGGSAASQAVKRPGSSLEDSERQKRNQNLTIESMIKLKE